MAVKMFGDMCNHTYYNDTFRSVNQSILFFTRAYWPKQQTATSRTTKRRYS